MIFLLVDTVSEVDRYVNGAIHLMDIANSLGIRIYPLLAAICLFRTFIKYV